MVTVSWLSHRILDKFLLVYLLKSANAPIIISASLRVFSCNFLLNMLPFHMLFIYFFAILPSCNSHISNRVRACNFLNVQNVMFNRQDCFKQRKHFRSVSSVVLNALWWVAWLRCLHVKLYVMKLSDILCPTVLQHNQIYNI